MIITQTPYRVSFLGGGTDYKPFFMEYGGSVLSTTIDKYCYISIRELPPFFEHNMIAKYSIVETKKEWDEIQHPSIRECLRYMNLKNVSISHDGDLPARAGLASSSAFTVGLLNGLHALKGEYCDKMTLAKEAIYVEQDLIRENVGVQDQIAVAMGGLNRIYFSSEGYEVRPVILSKERKKSLNDNLMLFFTGIVRFASTIAKEQIDNSKNRCKELKEMCQLVEEGEKLLTSHQSIHEFGRMLDYTWKLKRSLSTKISTDEIDCLYQKAREAGALGGKLLGAGGGGFILLYVEQEKQESVRKAMEGLIEVPFEFENKGSHTVFYNNN
jgi:D-glycero-alpha-D-manno-heptose-7-phosphate kinase